MHEAHGVHELVGGHSGPHAVRGLQGQGLPAAPDAQVGPAPDAQRPHAVEERHSVGHSRSNGPPLQDESNVRFICVGPESKFRFWCCYCREEKIAMKCNRSF